MEVISAGKLGAFLSTHRDSKAALLSWYHAIQSTEFPTPSAVRAAFPQVDYVKPFHVFNIGRGYRLIALIQFGGQRLFVRHVMNHREYDRGKWKIK
jgi:mRNA interferase HigB